MAVAFVFAGAVTAGGAALVAGAATNSSEGRKRKALFAMRNTFSRRWTMMETFAVMPGFNFKSELFTSMIVS
jgi:hypothetical protein